MKDSRMHTGPKYKIYATLTTAQAYNFGRVNLQIESSLKKVYPRKVLAVAVARGAEDSMEVRVVTVKDPVQNVQAVKELFFAMAIPKTMKRRSFSSTGVIEDYL